MEHRYRVINFNFLFRKPPIHLEQKKLDVFKSYLPGTAQKIRIAIWGFNDFAIKLYENIYPHIDVAAFIAENGINYKECRILSLKEFQADATLSSLPIVIAAPHELENGLPIINFETLRQFKLILCDLLKTLNQTNELLHPSALIDFLPLKFPKKIVSFGFYGSGNTIYNHLLLEISKLGSRAVKPTFWEILCSEYAQGIHHSFSDILYSHGGHYHHIAPWKFGMSLAHCMMGEVRLDIAAFPTRDHITHRAYGYHQIPSLTQLGLLREAEFNCFFVIRNPLDMLLSLLNKSDAIEKDTRKIDEKVFIRASYFLTRQLSAWTGYLDYLAILRYEDLIENPSQQIKNISRALKMKISNSEVNKIWKKIGFKQLPAAPAKHYWQGGSGRWESFFTPLHLQFLRELGMETLLLKYGYKSDLIRFKQLCSNDPESENLQRLLDTTHSILPSGDENFDSLLFLQAMYGEANASRYGQTIVASPDIEFTTKIGNILNQTYLNALIYAGMHSSKRII